MSGYLHRLVHTVSHPRETVHPRTGSLFAPRAPLLSMPANEQSRIESGNLEIDRQKDNDSSQRLENAHLSIIYHSPRIYESVQHAEVSRPAADRAQHDTLGPVVEVPQLLVAPEAQRAVPYSRHGAGDQSYLPLIQLQRSEGNSTRPGSPLYSTDSNSAREARANLPAAGRPIRTEPDEIQIHIGRIEVTAVQAPAARALKAPDKTLSLDAYLERRNGKAR
jgi:hypothetical protein